MKMEKLLSESPTRLAIVPSVIVSLIYILVVQLYFGPGFLQLVDEIVSLFLSPESTFLAFYVYGGWLIVIGLPLTLLLRFRLVLPLFLVILEQYVWLNSGPRTSESGIPLSVMFWPVLIVVLLVLGWIEYRIHVGLGVSVSPLVGS